MTKPITATMLMTLHGEGRIWLGRRRQHQFLGGYPVEAIIGVFMTQKMTPPETPALDFQSLAYQALVD